MSSPLKQNTTSLQELLGEINSLPTYVDTTSTTASASDILKGKTAYVGGKKVTGNIPNNGSVSQTMDGINTKSISVPAGYTSGGTVSLDNTIDNAVADAIAALIEKDVEVPDGTKVDGLASLIAAIEAGGGTATWGIITPASTDVVTIEHGLGKRPVVCGFLYASNFDNAPNNCCGHKTAIRQDASTGNYTNVLGSFSQPAQNISAYTQYGTSTNIPMDTETSEALTVTYNKIYINKNFLKFKPQSSRSKDNIAVGDTYIWYILGTD